MKTNKNQLLGQYRGANHLLSKKLSNIQQDLQLESQIRMPCIKKKVKSKNTSEIQLGNKLKRIININQNRKANSKSVQSHASFLNTYKQRENMSGFIKSQNLPQIKPIQQQTRNKSALDKILADRNEFAKAYFQQISKTQRMRKKKPYQDQFQQGIQFQFPEIRVGNWRVRAYLKQNHILLKSTHKDGHICIKKYDYKKVYQKIRRDYQTWVEQKFSFQT